jgi:hypothetical protein
MRIRQSLKGKKEKEREQRKGRILQMFSDIGSASEQVGGY